MPDWIKRIVRPITMHGLLRYAAGFQALVFVLLMVMGPERAQGYLSALSLDVGAILRGEVWRVVSFIALPPANPFTNFGLMWMFFAVIILFLLNDVIESHWGADGLTAFFVLGVFFALLAGLLGALLLPGAGGALAFIIPSLFGSSFLFTAACLEPRLTLRIFFFLPVPLALVAGLVAVTHIVNFLPAPLVLFVFLVSQAHFLMWALPRVFHAATDARDLRERRARFEAKSGAVGESFHLCEKCGATEASHPERDFRVAADGREICTDCLGRE